MFIFKSRVSAGTNNHWGLRPCAFLVLSLVSLTGCTTAPPLTIGNMNPANPAAERGLADAPAALDSYKSAADFAARSNEPAGTMEGMSNGAMPGMSGGGMPGMPGMEHGAMPGMSGGKTDASSTEKSAPTPAPDGKQNTVMPPDESKKSEQPGGHHE